MIHSFPRNTSTIDERMEFYLGYVPTQLTPTERWNYTAEIDKSDSSEVPGIIEKWEGKSAAARYIQRIQERKKKEEWQRQWSEQSSNCYGHGLRFLQMGEYVFASNYFTQVITSEIQDNVLMADAYYYRGMCRTKMKDNDGALADFNEVFKYRPGDSKATDAIQTVRSSQARTSYAHNLRATPAEQVQAVKVAPVVMSTASRQPARAPLQALQTAPAPARQQPVKAAPAVSQGTFKISPAEMAKRVNAEADKLILEGARRHVELKCSAPQNQTAQEKKIREQVVLEAAKTAKKLLQKPDHVDQLDTLMKAAAANVKLALGYPEDDFSKQMREMNNRDAINGIHWDVLNNERLESIVAGSINTLRRR